MIRIVHSGQRSRWAWLPHRLRRYWHRPKKFLPPMLELAGFRGYVCSCGGTVQIVDGAGDRFIFTSCTLIGDMREEIRQRGADLAKMRVVVR